MQLSQSQSKAIKPVIKALKKFGRAIMNWQTGTGKTYAACYATSKLDTQAIVICPASVKSHWKAVANETNTQMEIHSIESARVGKCWFYRTGEFKCSGKLLIFDEAHICENKNTESGFMLLSAGLSANKVLMLSATLGQTPDKWAVFWSVLGLGGFSKVCQRFGYISENEYVFTRPQEATNYIRKAIFEKYGSTLTVDAFKKDFPETEIRLHYIPIIPKLYGDVTRAMQQNELAKIDAICRMINADCSNLILVKYRKTARKLSQILKCDTITGLTPKFVRDKLTERFNKDKIPCLVATLDTCSTGISFHGTSNGRKRLCLISPDFNALNVKQALGRVHRLGGAPNSRVIVLTRSSLDKAILARITQKINNLEIKESI